MIKSLQSEAIPWLRGVGFTGSFPHLRRLSSQRTDLVTFQFDRYGGGFVVELAKAPAGDFETSGGERIPAKRLKAHDLDPLERQRLGARPGGDHWFRYDRGLLLFWRRRTFDELAARVHELLKTEAEHWWQDF